MRLLFLAIIFVQLFSINTGYAMSPEDELETGRVVRSRFQRRHDVEQIDTSVNVKRLSLARMIPDKIKPFLPLVFYLIFRFSTEMFGGWLAD
ncbi:MAG: hypothetical protein K2W94_05570 [Alphaproteobacteria bacterium]|nr:hypothetical protein [Alphaproteobacteria bacterium]